MLDHHTAFAFQKRTLPFCTSKSASTICCLLFPVPLLRICWRLSSPHPTGDLGVTLHLLITGRRDPVPDVPAVYFCEPSAENVELICRDLREQTYASVQLNFLSALPRQQLEMLAACAVDGECAASVTRVFDMYCNFVSLEPDFFMMRGGEAGDGPASYYALNNTVRCPISRSLCLRSPSFSSRMHSGSVF